MRTVEAPFEHVLRMSDDVGIFEHASGSTPERHHGYCVDDVARALVVVEREPRPTQALLEVADRYLDFVVSAQGPDGRCRNRLGLDRRWQDEPGVEDCWGRALWALGTAAARGRDEPQRDRAAARFALGASRRSPHLRSMVFAALGAAEVLAVAPGDKVARALLAAAVRAVGRPVRDAAWPWPEPRLAYAPAAERRRRSVPSPPRSSPPPITCSRMAPSTRTSVPTISTNGQKASKPSAWSPACRTWALS